MRTDPLLKKTRVLPTAGRSHKLSHFITVSLVELMEKKMVFGAVLPAHFISCYNNCQ